MSHQNRFQEISCLLGVRVMVPDGEMGLREGKGFARHPLMLGAFGGLGWGLAGAPVLGELQAPSRPTWPGRDELARRAASQNRLSPAACS